MERKIFQHLLELKSLQIRSCKSNEAVLVKRAVDDYHKSVNDLGFEVGGTLNKYQMREYTFKNFELFLYETLKTLQRPGTFNFQNISEVYREVCVCWWKMIFHLGFVEAFPHRCVWCWQETWITMQIKFQFVFPIHPQAERRISPDFSRCEKALYCTTKTHRCLHAAHAYTGIPCAAYSKLLARFNNSYLCLLNFSSFCFRHMNNPHQFPWWIIIRCRNLATVHTRQPTVLEHFTYRKFWATREAVTAKSPSSSATRTAKSTPHQSHCHQISLTATSGILSHSPWKTTKIWKRSRTERSLNRANSS